MITKLSIIIPAYNEEKTIHFILDNVISVNLINDIKKEIIIVNDCSKDNTLNVIKDYCTAHSEHDIKILNHEINKGKGAALHTGINNATGEYLIIQDADLEYDPQEYNILLKPVVDGFADVVYGSRFMGGKPHRILFFWHSIGNKMLTTFSNMLTNLNLSDMETCYKLIKTDIIQNINLKENRFGFEPEITAKIAQIPNLRIYEVGISYYGRTYAEGKKIGWKDGFRAIYSILKYNVFDKEKIDNKKNIKQNFCSKKFLLFFFFILFGYFSYITIFNNTKVFGTWMNEFYSDKAGYYIYLPATFINGYYSDNYKQNASEEFGWGFGFKNDKILTKYTCGVAILIFPFFIILHLILLLFGYDASGFSQPYHILVDITAAFYFAIGIIYLFKFLLFYISKLSSFITVLIIAFSTNLYFYTAIEPMMSHVYSFSMFSVFLYFYKSYLENGNKLKTFSISMLALWLAILIRPTNFFLVFILFFLDVNSISSFKNRLFHYINYKRILISILIAFVVVLPQLLYWKFVSGNYFYYSYNEEGFKYLYNPKLIEIWFAPLNGLFVYNPIYLLMFISLVFAMFKMKTNKFIGIASFLWVSYFTASWWMFYFGASYGARNFVEYNALFALPFGFLINTIIKNSRLYLKMFIFIVICYFTYFSINLENNLGRCFIGQLWDWTTYKNNINKAHIFPLSQKEANWFCDFDKIENRQPQPFLTNKNRIVPFNNAHSGNNVSMIDSSCQYSSGFNSLIFNFSNYPIKKAEVQVYLYAEKLPKDLILVCSNDNDQHKNLFNIGDKIESRITETNKWFVYNKTISLPENIDKFNLLSVYIWSPSKDKVFIDDFSIKFIY